ncbi:hypothetical protein CN950_23190 [Bacillus cereus]|nr:hypothetical protein CN407_02670 [Bacillus cereus]PGM62763.1 hypothetical protein CN950_23190 [Bacillus cereus]
MVSIPKIQAKVAGYFLILNGGMEHVSMQQRLLELEMLQNRKSKQEKKEENTVQVRFIIGIFTHEVTIPRIDVKGM